MLSRSFLYIWAGAGAALTGINIYNAKWIKDPEFGGGSRFVFSLIKGVIMGFPPVIIPLLLVKIPQSIWNLDMNYLRTLTYLKASCHPQLRAYCKNYYNIKLRIKGDKWQASFRTWPIYDTKNCTIEEHDK